MNLGEKIVAFRKAKNYTQEELANLSNVTLRTIQRIEKGDTVPRGFTLKSIADALGKEVSEFTIADSENPKLSTEQANSFLISLNFLCLTYLIVPYGNLFIPWIVWSKKKSQSEEVARVGKRIIAHQFIWMTIMSLALLLGAFIQILAKKQGYSPTFGILPIFLIIYLINIPFILVSAWRLKKRDHDVYRLTTFFIQ